MSRIPSLDGLRALSIICVLAGHAIGTVGISSQLAFLGFLSGFGVRVFFVISGFLITSLLMHEKQQTGVISLKHFYARRALRIFPAAYFYLACIAALWLSGAIEIRGGDLAVAASYTSTFRLHQPWYVAHLWSLSVEEWFYLLWPVTLVLVGPQLGSKVCVIAFLGSLGTHFLLDHSVFADWSSTLFPAVADSLALGCLIALNFDRLRSWPLLTSPAPTVLLFVMLMAWAALAFSHRYILGVTPLTNLLIGPAMLRSVVHPGRFLNWKPMVFLGTISYSLYLWQEPFINRQSRFSVFPVNIACAVCAALGSYYFIERPALRLKARFAVPGISE